MDKKGVIKKIAKITANVLLYAFIALCIIGIVLTMLGKRNGDGAVTVFGKQMRVVISPSMERCDATYDTIKKYDVKDIPTKSMIFIDVVPTDAEEAASWYADLEIGDVLTFKYVYVKQETITHRITDIDYDKESGGYIIELAGDNKNANSENLTQTINTAEDNSPNYVIGRVTSQSYALGLLVSALRSPVGLVCIVIIPSLAIVVLEIIRIVNTVGADKRKREKEEKEKQQSELDELRRRLAELEEQKREGEAVTPPKNETNGDEP